MNIGKMTHDLYRTNPPSSAAPAIAPAAAADRQINRSFAERELAGANSSGAPPFPMQAREHALEGPDRVDSAPRHREKDRRTQNFLEMVAQIPAHLLTEMGPDLLNNAARLPSREALDTLRMLGISMEPRSESNPHGYDPQHCPISAAIASAQWEMIGVLLELGVWPGPPILRAYEFMPPVVKGFLSPYVMADSLEDVLDDHDTVLPGDWIEMPDGEEAYSSTTSSTSATSSTSSTSSTSTTSTTSTAASNSGWGSAESKPDTSDGAGNG